MAANCCRMRVSVRSLLLATQPTASAPLAHREKLLSKLGQEDKPLGHKDTKDVQQDTLSRLHGVLVALW